MKRQTLKRLWWPPLFAAMIATGAQAWEASLLTEAVAVDGMVTRLPEFSISRPPGTKIPVTAASPLEIARADSGGSPARAGIVAADAPGWQEYRVTNTRTGEVMSLSVFSLVTADAVDERGHLGEFRVGGYPKKRLRNLAIYDPPPGFIRVDERTREKKVSPNFRLGQFLCKQVGGYPKYLALDPALLVKLEKILAALNAAGRRTDSLHVMSGYRTPWYNAAIGNVKYSRHLWGGAADIFVDADPRDGVMDDLNRDGVVNREDAVWLAGFIDEMASSGQFETPGGIGSYGSTSAHGPFVHVDVRGYRARW